MLLGACGSDEGTSFEIVAEGQCERMCEKQFECVGDRFFGSVEACADHCNSHVMIASQSQCTSRAYAHFECLGDVSCEDYEVWLGSLDTLDDVKHVCEGEERRKFACSVEEPYGT